MNYYAHNGPVCGICHTPYIGTHACTREQIQRVINELETLKSATPETKGSMSGCPCRRENGGSGICGCVLGGYKVTC